MEAVWTSHEQLAREAGILTPSGELMQGYYGFTVGRKHRAAVYHWLWQVWWFRQSGFTC